MSNEQTESNVNNVNTNIVENTIEEKKELQKSNPQTINDLLKRYKNEIAQALPKHLTADRMCRIICTELRKIPKLAQCTPISLMGCVMQCSQLGLEPGGILGHAYLIPFNNTHKNIVECQFIIGYRGMIDLARRSGCIQSISAHEVYSNDQFYHEFGINEKCVHIPVHGDRGIIIGAYANIKLKDGGHQYDFMTNYEINKIRDKAPDYSNWVKYGKKGKDPIWVSHYAEMAKKTVIRRIFKMLPISVEIQKAVALDEAAERGEQDNSFFIENDTESNEIVKSRSDQVADRINI